MTGQGMLHDRTRYVTGEVRVGHSVRKRFCATTPDSSYIWEGLTSYRKAVHKKLVYKNTRLTLRSLRYLLHCPLHYAITELQSPLPSFCMFPNQHFNRVDLIYLIYCSLTHHSPSPFPLLAYHNAHGCTTRQ